MKKDSITLKTRSKLEFARLFCDDSFSEQAAYRWLREEIRNNEPLYQELMENGYKPHAHLLSPRIQSIMLKYLLPPNFKIL